MLQYLDTYKDVLFDEGFVKKSTELSMPRIFPWADGGVTSAKTGLNSKQFVQIKAAMSRYFGDRRLDPFEAFLAGQDDQLSLRDQKALDYMLQQLYGGAENNNLVEQSISGQWQPSTVEFEPIKSAMEKFISDNISQSQLRGDIKPPVAYFPLSKYTSDDWWTIEARLNRQNSSPFFSQVLDYGLSVVSSELTSEQLDT